MKFACIEYRTKSGKIWKAEENKPNYLCNPDTEIDNTSYGTWTSALHGEHIPLRWIVEGKNDPSYNELIKRQALLRQRILLKIRKILVRRSADPLHFANIDYLKEFDLILLCIHYEVADVFADLAKSIKERFPSQVLLTTYGTFNLGRVREFWRNNNWFRNFKDFINAGDAFVVVNPGTESYFELICKKPIIYFPQLYPIEYTKKFFRNYLEKENVIFIGGSTQRMDNVWSALLAKKIQSDLPQFKIRVIGTNDFNFEVLKGAQYEILPNLSWEKYLFETSKCKLIINMDNWWTNGRVPTDAAAVGTPCIGVNAGRQVELFPTLAFDDIIGNQEALNAIKQLLKSEEIYYKVTDYAYRTLEKYDYEEGAERIRDLFTDLNKPLG
ncbi:MAG: glycosyltransferase [Bacteroidetes bacterium]|nr:glycosyltransferase [Bacteroidota bacterium]